MHLFIVREMRREQLDGNQTFHGDVAREKDDSHTASSELTLDRVSTHDHLLEGQQFRRSGGSHARCCINATANATAVRARVRDLPRLKGGAETRLQAALQRVMLLTIHPHALSHTTRGLYSANTPLGLTFQIHACSTHRPNSLCLWNCCPNSSGGLADVHASNGTTN